jgi:hypothetical protein
MWAARSGSDECMELAHPNRQPMKFLNIYTHMFETMHVYVSATPISSQRDSKAFVSSQRDSKAFVPKQTKKNWLRRVKRRQRERGGVITAISSMLKLPVVVAVQ